VADTEHKMKVLGSIRDKLKNDQASLLSEDERNLIIVLLVDWLLGVR
jgi:hypothetical protein